MDATIRNLAIIGGGPAGMAAALMAGRCRLNAVVINEENPRNLASAAGHGFLTRDGTPALQMLAVAKEQLRKYPTLAYQKDKVLAVTREDGGFVVRRAAGPDVRAERVILATGYRDDLESLRIPGIRNVYGRSVYPCPFCDGFEHSGERIAVFGAEGVDYYVPIVRMWSDDVHVFTNGRALSPQTRDALARNDVPVHEAKIHALDAKDGRLTAVRLENGTVERDVGFLWDRPGVPATSHAEDLGVRTKEGPGGTRTYEADEFGRTNVPGVYVVGDLRTSFSRLMAAANEGGRCVEQIVRDIAHSRWR